MYMYIYVGRPANLCLRSQLSRVTKYIIERNLRRKRNQKRGSESVHPVTLVCMYRMCVYLAVEGKVSFRGVCPRDDASSLINARYHCSLELSRRYDLY